MFAGVWIVAAALAAAPLSVDGGLPTPFVEDVLTWHANELNACFKGAPKAAQLKYRFGITPEGKVGSLGFIDAKGLTQPRVTCLGTIVEGLGFPAVDGGTNVELTFKPTKPFDAGTPELERVPLAPSWAEAIERCHSTNEKGLGDGRLTLDLWLAPSGAVVDAVASEPTLDLQAPGFLPCIASAARHWMVEGGTTWRHAQLDLILGRTEAGEKKYFNPKAPAVFVKVRGNPDAPSVKGGIDSDLILKVIRTNRGQITGCYEWRLMEKPGLVGKVAVAFRIGPDGKVVRASVTENSTADDELGNCVTARVLSWEFPQPIGGGDVDVTFPWIFQEAGRGEDKRGMGAVLVAREPHDHERSVTRRRDVGHEDTRVTKPATGGRS